MKRQFSYAVIILNKAGYIHQINHKTKQSSWENISWKNTGGKKNKNQNKKTTERNYSGVVI